MSKKRKENSQITEYIKYTDVLPSDLVWFRKSLSWHTALRIRRKSEKRDKEGRKLENGYRKSQDSLANKVSVKVELDLLSVYFYAEFVQKS